MPFVDQDPIALSEQGYALCLMCVTDLIVKMLLLNNPPGHSVPEQFGLGLKYKQR